MPPPTMTTLASLGRFTMGREFTRETFFHNGPFRGQRVRLRDVPYSLAANLLSHLFLKAPMSDRKSTRLNSSHSQISYAVFCLKKKKKKYRIHHTTYNCVIN